LYVATLLCFAGILWFAYSQGWRPKWRQTRRGAALLLAGGIVALSGCGGFGHAKAAIMGRSRLEQHTFIDWQAPEPPRAQVISHQAPARRAAEQRTAG
jgi:hypothetical protein